MDINQEILTSVLELEYRQQQLLEFTQRVIGKAISAGWSLTEVQNEMDNRPIPRLHLVPPIPDHLPDDIA
jgi:hypothetical protein